MISDHELSSDFLGFGMGGGVGGLGVFKHVDFASMQTHTHTHRHRHSTRTPAVRAGTFVHTPSLRAQAAFLAQTD